MAGPKQAPGGPPPAVEEASVGAWVRLGLARHPLAPSAVAPAVGVGAGRSVAGGDDRAKGLIFCAFREQGLDEPLFNLGFQIAKPDAVQQTRQGAF